MSFSTKRTQYFSAAPGFGPEVITIPSVASLGKRICFTDPSGKVTGMASCRSSWSCVSGTVKLYFTG